MVLTFQEGDSQASLSNKGGGGRRAVEDRLGQAEGMHVSEPGL